MPSKRMLIDASHPEETRVVVLSGNRLEEFDYETTSKKQLKGNIYLAKVTRVEPSLQAAFVEYGGNRHGFLPFSEIHPDYYRIPIADRELLLAEAAAQAKAQDDDDDEPEVEEPVADEPEIEDAGADEPELDEPAADAQVGEAVASPLLDDVPEDPSEAEAPVEDAPGLYSTALESPDLAAPDSAGPDEDPFDLDDPFAVRPSLAADELESADLEAADLDAADLDTADLDTANPDAMDWAAAVPESADLDPTSPDAFEGMTETPEAEAFPPESVEPPLEVDEPDTLPLPAESVAVPVTQEAAELPFDATDEAADGDSGSEADEPSDPAASGPRAIPLAATQEIITGEVPPAEGEGEAPRPRAKRSRRSGGKGRGKRGESKADPEELEVERGIETVGGDEVEEDARKRRPILQRYKIQEVIKRRQVILVQVAKEERGTKGAALTTYLSLAGRYCVLMPNTARGGGISRKISNATDRRRLKKVTSELEVPEGMAVIVRTAGSERSKAEIRRDYDYLLRLWDQIRETTLESTAPSLIHEEANLIKRSIRDLYDRDMEKIEVQGDESYKEAKAFMKSLMPSHARKVQFYKEQSVPLFFRDQVEDQLDAMHQTTVRLRSGGYIVINPTEALVAVDVNSGKATKERHIEETALKTNLEAADEIARQLRLRDLAGLIVIDFIDMEENRHNREVERRLKEAMRLDRARIQLGRISPFGLLEMSRQRLRPSLVENATQPCNLCGGAGRVRSIESSALHVLRAVEEQGIRRQGGQIQLKVPTAVALYILNQKRARLLETEQRYDFEVLVEQDDNLIAPDFMLDHFGAQGNREAEADDEDEAPAAEAGDQEQGRRKRRRRRTRRRDSGAEAARPAEPDELEAEEEPALEAEENGDEEDDEAGQRKARRRRGKRGGRRRARSKREEDGAEESWDDAGGAEAPANENEQAEAADPDGDQAEASARPKSRRTRSRGRRKRGGAEAEAAAEQPAAEQPDDALPPAAAEFEAPAEPEPLPVPEEAEAEPEEEPLPEDPAGPEGEDTPAVAEAPALPEQPPLAAEAPEPEPEPEETKPKRRGWWNRFV